MENPTLQELIEDFRESFLSGEDEAGCLNCAVTLEDGREVLVIAEKTRVDADGRLCGFRLTMEV